MTEKQVVLAAIVNLEEQLRNADDDGSYGTIDGTAAGPQTTSAPQRQGQELRPSVSSLEVDAADVASTNADSSRAKDDTGTNAGTRRNRIKNSILSKWKPKNRLLPKRNEEENQEENDDVESPYIALDEAPIRIATPERPASVQSITAATKEASANEPNVDLLGLEKGQTKFSFNNSPEPAPKPLKLSSELFHWYIHRSWKKKLLTLLVVASSGVVLYDLLFCQGSRVKNFLDGFLYWMGLHPLLGIYGYIVVLAGASLIYIPPSPLVISSGFIFRSIYGPLSGPLLALVASYVGAVLGGFIGYIRAHYMTRDLIRILMRRYPLLRAIDAAVVRNSLRVMILLRLNPLIPFGVLNYLFGISGVSGASFILGLVGVVPWHLWLICLGASANSFVYDMDEGEELGMIVLYGMGCAFGVIGLMITWKFAKKELQKEVNAQAINDFRIQNLDQAPQYTDRRSDNEIELSDMEFGDYFRMQFLGINVNDAVEVEEEDYRSKLEWELLILDDFS